ncbi:sensor histidine kinase [Kineothrix sp. MB12-C1]|uniref:sensor histidine kinase n=1 Tax=Kineothrix sp. MB12-C1 TaxID=3070215 RepID=UPI0027D34D81|nr:histidine kinase [Kineothrix sp. MB12-C1]WMC91325.1 histidine kinase [Kineothrix sp. MB12-C1]
MNEKNRKRIQRIQDMSLQTKIALTLVTSSIIIFAVNLFMYININSMVNRLDVVYQGNIKLNELNDALTNVQTSMTTYLNTKSSDSMEDYYRSEQNYQSMIEELNDKSSNDPLLLMERNIRYMSGNYLELTNQTVEAKRGRNVEKYKVRYESASELYDYINTYIYSLNNEQFKNNSLTYEALSISFKSLELVSNGILICVVLCNVILTIVLTRTITNPLKILAAAANEVAKGNFDLELLDVRSGDEVGVVTKAFNKMIVNIRAYIVRVKTSMEMERAMKEKELMMEAHLKDAQLKYLQAQINPHFLFNTLNAGAQLAMMEHADRTYEYVQNMAGFFRYNMKNNEIVTLGEEISLVDSYIYILNVRFSGEIHFEKNIDERFNNIQVPVMILQPIVENSVNYGIRDITWEGKIILSVYEIEDSVCISIKDNGVGISEEMIDKILEGRLRSEDISGNSNGIGLDNVINRLKLLLDREDVFEIVCEGENMGTEVRIYIPVQERRYEDV